MTTMIEDNAQVLLQGDSVTSDGGGYAMMVAAWFSAMYPGKNVTFLNRGAGGNRAKDLEARWQKDCLDLRPTWVSIQIGINDTWRRFDQNDPTTTEAYAKAYRSILTLTRDELGAKLILMEPFVLPYPEDRKQWRVDLDPRIQVVRALAREFGAILIPLDGIFAEAATHREPAYWSADGVHPSLPGHALIAQAWLKAVKAI